jgi:hypothetical protein
MSENIVTYFLEWLTVDAELTCEIRGSEAQLFVSGAPATRAQVARWALQWLAFTHQIATAELLEFMVSGTFAKLQREGSFPKKRRDPPMPVHFSSSSR